MIETFSTHSNIVNVGVLGLNRIKFLRNAEKILQFNLLKSELRSCNPLLNAHAKNAGGVGQMGKCGPKIGCHSFSHKINQLVYCSHSSTNPK